ncbi:MAG: FAD-dependent oxidoreductase [Saprospiraceae bacterium]|nr:FAD-dependent oxidoreductase [Saprospiraceae bacterium]MCF8249109.1 FAD-dependent oxidoreductase [Saprospiraceae bacterium]MCF8281366.1 FAD-dependent oxidoreductase [Bacteroidales bacterium]MCF8311131.1 FAD-dependent oxidoreductase [Saprospiraceae bacterium]MCF8440221.1 FAD-dependent oxidoreductase [Saprospiraceae bacterium]
MTTWYNGNITRIEDASPTTKRFWLEVEGEEHFDFEAGQFITMDLPIGERRNQRWRSYSIASAPGGSNVMELCIVHLDNGLASGYLFNEAKVGTTIKFKGPDGTFTLPESLENELVLVCTGTGVAPFRSMVWDIFNKKIPHRGIHLIFGTRTSDGILYQQEFEELARKMPGFRYSVALSREESEVHHHGYVHDIYLKNYKEKRTNVTFYLCGWTKMVDEAVANLIVKMGYGREQVKYELYG